MKKIMSILLLVNFVSISLTSCMSKKITVTGQAENDDNIATLFTKTQQYFLSGVHNWDSICLHKMVRVRGVLYIHKFKEDSLFQLKQGLVKSRGVDMDYLLKPKWKLLK
jgi:hypothetical protein